MSLALYTSKNHSSPPGLWLPPHVPSSQQEKGTRCHCTELSALQHRGLRQHKHRAKALAAASEEVGPA